MITEKLGGVLGLVDSGVRGIASGVSTGVSGLSSGIAYGYDAITTGITGVATQIKDKLTGEEAEEEEEEEAEVDGGDGGGETVNPEGPNPEGPSRTTIFFKKIRRIVWEFALLFFVFRQSRLRLMRPPARTPSPPSSTTTTIS